MSTTTMMTNQEAFNLVWERAKDKRKSALPGVINPGGLIKCRYRGPNGLKCFVGVLIPDEYYQEEFEGMGPVVATTKVPELRRLDLTLLVDLQGCHDRYSTEHWECRLRMIASSYRLEVKELSQRLEPLDRGSEP